MNNYYLRIQQGCSKTVELSRYPVTEKMVHHKQCDNHSFFMLAWNLYKSLTSQAHSLSGFSLKNDKSNLIYNFNKGTPSYFLLHGLFMYTWFYSFGFFPIIYDLQKVQPISIIRLTHNKNYII